MTFDNLIESSTFPLWHTAHYSKTCLVQHLCNPFHCVMQPWFSFQYNHFPCVFTCVFDTLSITKQNSSPSACRNVQILLYFVPDPQVKCYNPTHPCTPAEGYSLILQPLSWAEQANSRWPAEPHGTFQWWPHLASQLYACAEYSSCPWKIKTTLYAHISIHLDLMI